VTKGHERKYIKISCGHGWRSKYHNQEKFTSLFKALVMGNGVKQTYTKMDGFYNTNKKTLFKIQLYISNKVYDLSK
jgi:hypothetical protein